MRIPACYTGCYGFKPTFGRIPNDRRSGCNEWNDTSVDGPLTRTVRDARFSGRGCRLPSVRSRFAAPSGDFVSAYLTIRKTSRRISSRFRPTRAARRDARSRKGGRRLQEAGLDLTTIDNPVPDTGRDWMHVGATQGYACCMMAQRGSRRIRTRVPGRHRIRPSLHMGHYRRGHSAPHRVQRWCQSVFEHYDLLLYPVLPTEAFPAKGPLPTEIDGKPLDP